MPSISDIRVNKSGKTFFVSAPATTTASVPTADTQPVTTAADAAEIFEAGIRAQIADLELQVASANINLSTQVTNLGNISAVLTVNAAANQRVFKCVLLSDVGTFTLATTSTGYAAVIIAITQGGSGSHNISYPVNFRWQGGFSPSLSTAVGATDILQAITFDAGTTWLTAIVMQAAP